MRADSRPAYFEFTPTEEDLSACGGRIEVWSATPGADGCKHVHLIVTDSGELVLSAGPPGVPGADDLESWRKDVETIAQMLPLAYRAAVSQVPFVIATESAAFSEGSRLLARIRFLWYALPEPWSVSLPMQTFTRQSLEGAPASVVAIPVDLARNVLQTRRDAVLVSESGELGSGEEAGGIYSDYARLVVQVVTEAPEHFESFRRRLIRLLPERRAPDARAIAAMPIVIALTYGNQPYWPDGLDLLSDQILLEGDLEKLAPTELCCLIQRSGPFYDSLRDRVFRLLEKEPGWAGLSPADWDKWLERDPSMGMSALLAAGQWSLWRSATSLSKPALRRAALAWCANEHWNRDEPFLEDWVVIVRDLGALSEEEAGLAFPKIEWFQTEQEADLAQRVVRKETRILPAITASAESSTVQAESPPPRSLRDYLAEEQPNKAVRETSFFSKLSKALRSQRSDADN